MHQSALTERIQLTERGRAQLRALRENGTIKPSALDKIRAIMQEWNGTEATAWGAMRQIDAVLLAHKSPFDD